MGKYFLAGWGSTESEIYRLGIDFGNLKRLLTSYDNFSDFYEHAYNDLNAWTTMKAKERTKKYYFRAQDKMWRTWQTGNIKKWYKYTAFGSVH